MIWQDSHSALPRKNCLEEQAISVSFDLRWHAHLTWESLTCVTTAPSITWLIPNTCPVAANIIKLILNTCTVKSPNNLHLMLWWVSNILHFIPHISPFLCEFTWSWSWPYKLPISELIAFSRKQFLCYFHTRQLVSGYMLVNYFEINAMGPPARRAPQDVSV